MAAGLAVAWRRHGRRVALVKPLSLREDDPDPAFLAATAGPESPASAHTLSGASLAEADADAAARRVQSLASDADVVIVDGLPLTGTDGQAIAGAPALVQRLGATAVGVQPYAADLGAEAAAVWRDAFGDALAGVVVNRRPRYAGHFATEELGPRLGDASAPVLGVVPEERLMLAPTLRQTADHLAATFFCWPSEDQRLIEHFLIGGLIMEWGGNYFGRLRNQAVIVRGGRIDIQMAALNFPLSCLLLTGCSAPPQYVHQRAESQEVPVLVVDADTQTTAAALESVQEQVSVHHPEKTERFADLLTEHLDWGRLDSAAGLV